MSKSKFYDQIHNATVEKDVEETYNIGLKKYFNNVEIKHPHACDSFIETYTASKKILRLLVEYKYDEKLNIPTSRAKVLVQALFYLQRFEQSGEILPNVVMVGDINECFVLHTNSLAKYLDEQIDWTTAPSEAAANNPVLVLKIANDTDIVPFVYDVNDTFSFKDVAEQIIALADNVQRLVRITIHNILPIYDYFVKNVVNNQSKGKSEELVAAFIGSISDRENYFQNPTNPSILMANGKKISINASAYNSFFGYFKRDYSMTERSKFTEIADRLIEDTSRRKSGDFFTPTPFVDYAHKMLCEQFGEDWKEKYVVWDCCWGTGNLTRDYRFKELYASTLMDSELQMGEHYNREATKFQMDFLNDPIEPNLYGTKVPQGLLNALKEDRPILFFINPPYGTSSNDFGSGGGTKGKGTTTSTIYKEMLNYKLGNSVNNLFSQFLYRIMKIKNDYKLSVCNICLYSPTILVCGSGYDKFRKLFLNNFSFKTACQFDASNFSDVSDSWAISLSIWKNGITENKIEFPYSLLAEENGCVSIIGAKTLYNLDDNKKSLKTWIKEPIKKVETIERPTFSSGIVLKEGKNCKTKIAANALGCYSNMGNNVMQNGQKVSLFSSSDSTNSNGLSILPENFERVLAAFSARRLIECVWHINTDEYFAPNEHHIKWSEYVSDSIIYALFELKSNQSSLRNIEYKGKKWNIKNEFFFMSKQRIMELADANRFVTTYEDARTDSERYVYKLISGQENLVSETLSDKRVVLSPEAKAVLDKAIELTEKTFPYRGLFNQSHPDYQIMNWDCGWYQIKAVVGEYFKNDLTEFQQLYKTLSDKMRPMVYELGFLK